MIDETLLAILACPVCKAPLRLEEQTLVCTKTHVRYPVEEGIPILLADRAEPPHPGGEAAGGQQASQEP
jgi:uncharacterized protein YbaR (Trm112 family)